MMKRDFFVECNVCGSRLKNWSGSTPCCGSIAFIIDDAQIKREEREMKLKRIKNEKN